MTAAIRVALTLTQDWHRVPGGTAVAANSLARALHERADVHITGVGPRGGPPTPGFEPPVTTRRLRVPVPWLYDVWDLLQRPGVSTVVPDAQLVHLTLPMSPPRDGVPLVSTVHDVLPLTMPEMFSRRGVRLMGRGLARIRQRAAMVMVPTTAGRDEFVAQGFDPRRLAVVPLGVHLPPELDDRQVTGVLERYGVEPPYVLFVGTAEPRKGLDVLADAVSLLDRREVTLVLVGPRGWGEIGSVGPGPLVAPGHVPDVDLHALRSAAAVCALPSRAEGFGLPVLEAMAAGRPVVTTSGTPMEEFATGVAHLVPIGDSRALAQALAEVLDDPGAAALRAAPGVRRARGYTWERTAERVADVYREALG